MDIETRRRDGVLEIEFNRPAKKNAFTAEMYAAMATALDEAQGDKAVRVVLFHGTPEIFTAGNDIEDFIRRPPSGEDAPVFRFLRTVSRAPMPLVAAVNGAAVGIGTTLLLHCELVYAGDNARFSLPFTSLGVVPEFASSYLLPQIAGYQRAAELLLLAQPFGPDQALAAGIVTRVLPPGETLEAARAAAARLASLPQKSVRLTKALMKSAHQAHIDAQLLTEGNHFRQLLGEPAAREAMAAFIEKRKPDFSRDN